MDHSARRTVLTRDMTLSPKRHALVLAALSALAVTALTGCAPILDTLRNEAASTYPTSAELVEGWGKAAAWLPDDSTQISIRETPDADPAVLLATSSAALDPALCTETVRRSAPIFTVEGAPDAYVESVFACGDWAVIPTDDGWYGWTPSHPEEKAASAGIG